jgi:hypothetical protein
VASGVKAGRVTITARSGETTGTATLTVTGASAALVTMPAGWVKRWPVKTGRAKTATVGKRLKVTKPVYSAAGKQQHLVVSYQWYVGGSPVAGATKRTFKVGKAFLGKKVILVVTVTKPGYQPRTKRIKFGKAR